MARVGGTAFFRINGASFSTDGEFDIQIKGVKREEVPASDGSIHFTESVVGDKISGSLIMIPGMNPDAITNMVSATILVSLKNGTQAMLDDAFFSGDASSTTREGKMQIEFTGVGQWLP